MDCKCSDDIECCKCQLDKLGVMYPELACSALKLLNSSDKFDNFVISIFPPCDDEAGLDIVISTNKPLESLIKTVRLELFIDKIETYHPQNQSFNCVTDCSQYIVHTLGTCASSGMPEQAESEDAGYGYDPADFPDVSDWETCSSVW
jgi:hypothetical protein